MADQLTAQLPAGTMFGNTPVYNLANGDVVFGLRLPVVLPSNADRAFTVDAPRENRLDLIAAQTEQADRAWWALADATALIDPLAGVTVGTVIRIPPRISIPTT